MPSSRASGGSGDRAATGARAEAAVADYLTVCGYDILMRNARAGHLEVDIVAQRGDLVAFVEVRARGPGALEGALESFRRRKSERVRRAVSRLWATSLASRPDVERVRVDVAAVMFDGPHTRVEHVEGVLA